MKRFVTLFFRLMLDKRVPLRVKILPFIAIAYIVYSRDILPDVLPIVGILDDLIITAVTMILYFALGSVSRVANDSTKSNHRNTDARNTTSSHTVIDGEFHAVEDENDQEKE